MWSTVGFLLVLIGIHWLLNYHWAIVLLPAVVAAAMLKSWFILDRVARRIIDRIRSRDDHRCIGGFLSLKSWLTIAAMMMAGRLLRGGSAPRLLVGCLYTTIGMALLLSSRHLWRGWRDARARP
jgi:uncharacterized membrane protein YqgA involved in biofilm formation